MQNVVLDDDVKLDQTMLQDFPELLKFPIEIREGVASAAFRYIYDLRSGQVQTYRNKIMMLGWQNVGKTTLCNTMFPIGAIFQKNREFTRMSLQGYTLTLSHYLKDMHLDIRKIYSISRNNTTIRITIHPNLPETTKSLVIQSTFEPELTKIAAYDEYLLSSIVELSFESSEISRQWMSALQHWTNNTATEGIVTSVYQKSKNGRKDAIDLCVMDFAGQDE